MARLIAIAPTDDEAREVARRGAQWTVTAYVNPERRKMMPGYKPDPNAPPPPADPVQRYVDEVIIHGSPGRMVEEILRLREEIGLDYLLCAPLSHQSFLLMTEEVIPALARVTQTV
jgi:alkanesulfonate monooxygenase SsuD/methylene tetrahydromethanopterin reductase-like flavin-dependent oxidoreductase (luciferase family)